MHFLNSKFILHKQLLKISLSISRIDKILFGCIISLNYQKKKMLRINNMVSIQSIGFQRVSQDWSDLACRPPTKVIRGDKATSLLPSCVQAFLFLNSLLESGWEFLSKKKKKMKSGVSHPQDIYINLWEMRVDRRWFFADYNLRFLS